MRPSHFILQQMDYNKPIYEFADKIFYAHFKDAKILKDKLDEHGIMAYPLQYVALKLPGLGDVDFSRYISALTDVGYEGYTSIEIEDAAYDSTEAGVRKGIQLAKRYLSQYLIRLD